MLRDGEWQQVRIDVGAVAAGKQVRWLALSFDSGTANGQFRGTVDDVEVSHPASP